MNIPVPSKQEIMARALAKMGRSTDTNIAHVTPGDMVIPATVIQQNPQLGQFAASTIASLGGDPSRYVVGMPDNSINPATGRPEFFDWRDLIQVVAPAAAGAYFDLGSLGTALTSGAVNKLTGGSWGEALASGAGAYLGSELSNYFAPDQTIGGAIGEADPRVQAGINNASTASGIVNSVANTPLNYAAAGLGGYLGSQAYGAYQRYTNPGAPPPLNLPAFDSIGNASRNEVTPMPMPNNNGNYPTPQAAAPTDYVYGVSYATPVKDRDSGLTRYVSADDSDDERRSRGYTWGNVMTI